MHPIVREYLETNAPLIDIVMNYLQVEPKNVLCKKLYKLSLLLASPRNETDRFVFKDEFLFKQNYDNDLVLIFYQLSARLAFYYQKPEIGFSLYKKSFVFIDQNTPPYLMHLSSVGLLTGNEWINLIEKHLVDFGSTSPRFENTMVIYLQKLACMGHLSDEKPGELYAKNTRFSPDEKKIQMALFTNYVETHQLEKAKALKDLIFSSGFSIGEGTSQYLDVLDFYKLLYEAIFETESWEKEHFEKNKNILIIYLLLKRDCIQALEVAKKYHQIDLSRMLFFNLLRCELVNKNFESAARILNQIIEGGESDYLLNFYAARIELAKGNREIAMGYFSNAYKLCNEYHAEGLFDFELGLSYEMSIADLKYIFENLNKSKVKILSINKLKSTQNEKSTEKLIGISKEILVVKNKIKNYADLEIPVLIMGETGVGKDVISRLLHEESSRKDKPYFAINCGALTETLLQSELFGHEAGSFTGANKEHKGLFEMAGEGTLFLDEIGEISPSLQVSLLRVLDQKEFRAVGGNKLKKAKCRVVFATNANLEQMVSEKRFRKDLLFRLKRLEIFMCPLRERKEDISELIRYYLTLGRSDEHAPKVAEDLMLAFKVFSWPGNVRQLKNEMEKLRALHSDKLYYDLKDFSLKDNLPLSEDSSLSNSSQSPKVSSKSIELVDAVLGNSKSAIRRLDTLKEIFLKYKKFTRKELIEITKYAPKTVAKDLELLCAEGFLVRIEPSSAARTHYFILKET